eukprot:scaffold99941_cov61-Phaeocystis_antarctica.AAC.4
MTPPSRGVLGVKGRAAADMLMHARVGGTARSAAAHDERVTRRDTLKIVAIARCLSNTARRRVEATTGHGAAWAVTLPGSGHARGHGKRKVASSSRCTLHHREHGVPFKLRIAPIEQACGPSPRDFAEPSAAHHLSSGRLVDLSSAVQEVHAAQPGEGQGVISVKAAPTLGPQGVVGGRAHEDKVAAAREQRDVDESGVQPLGAERVTVPMHRVHHAVGAARDDDAAKGCIGDEVRGVDHRRVARGQRRLERRVVSGDEERVARRRATDARDRDGRLGKRAAVVSDARRKA